MKQGGKGIHEKVCYEVSYRGGPLTCDSPGQLRAPPASSPSRAGVAMHQSRQASRRPGGFSVCYSEAV